MSVVIDLEAARRRLHGTPAWLLCPDCELAAGPYPARDARTLRGLHDRVMHAGARTALTQPVTGTSQDDGQPPTPYALPDDAPAVVLSLTS